MIHELKSQGSQISGVIISFLSVLTFIISFYITRYYFDNQIKYSNEYVIIVLFIILFCYNGISQTHITKYYFNKDIYKILLHSTLFVITVTLLLFLLQIVFNLRQISSYVILIFSFFDLIMINTMLFIFMAYHKKLLNKGMNIQNIIIIADSSCIDFIEKLDINKKWGYHINSIISDSQLIEEIFASRFRIYKNIDRLSTLIRQDVIDEVLYCKNAIDQNEIMNLIYNCEEIGVIFRMQSSFFHLPSTQTHVNYYDGIPFLSFVNTPVHKLSHNWKSVVDIIVSLFILIIWSPFILIIAVAIKATSEGPIIFKQKRVGLRGRIFEIYKFRTMVQDAEKQRNLLETYNEMDGPVFKINKDPRITSVGKLLRKTGLDEIPQFLNVLNGDMSLVGPRPPLPSEVNKYERWQLRRLSMLPGITCIWQIAPNRNKISFNEWMKLDLQYIDSWSLKLDFFLLVKTVQTVLRGSGQ